MVRDLGICCYQFGADSGGGISLVAFWGCPSRGKYCVNKRSWNKNLGDEFSIKTDVTKL